MGVNIGDIVPRHEIEFVQLREKIIAIDAYNVIYQFLSSIRGADGTPLKDSEGNVTSHLQGLFSRSLNLMGKGLKLVYVFDGKPPELKSKERERRKNLKLEAGDKYDEAVDTEDVALMSKYAARMSRLTPKMVDEAKKLVSALGLPVVQAPSEADAQISYMCKKEDVDYAASMDYDCLLFGAPYLIRNLTLSQKRKVHGGKYVYTYLELVKLDEVLKSLDIDRKQMIILGILTGTDFNVGGVKGIGPKKALKLIKDSKDYNEMFKDLEVDFDWQEIYSIFDGKLFGDDYSLSWGKLDVDKINEILVSDHEFNEERVSKMISNYKIELEKNSQTGLGNYF